MHSKTMAIINDTPFPLADANGNAVTYLDNAGNVQAHYVYDAFGGTVSSDGDMADVFRFRFSSKYLDDETELYYYGFRYYDSAMGRWISKDPIGERGGLLLYGFVGNSGVNIYDNRGLFGGPAMTQWADSLSEEPCCGDEPYDPSTHCCIDDHPYSKEKKPTGIKRCCAYSKSSLPIPINVGYNSFGSRYSGNLGTVQLYRPDHCWVQYPMYGSSLARGYYPSKGVISEYDESKQDPYPDRRYGIPYQDETWVICEELKGSECDYDLSGIAECMDIYMPSVPYEEVFNDCRQFSSYVYSHCINKGRRGLMGDALNIRLPPLGITVGTISDLSGRGSIFQDLLLEVPIFRQ